MGKRGSLSMLAAIVLAAPAAAQPLATSAILLDGHTGEILFQNDPDSVRHPASITKIMTLYLAFEALAEGRIRPGDPLVMTRRAVSQKPSRLGLGVGRSLPIEQAIRIIAVKSANDLAMALAERIGGSEAAFVERMNARARTLGMTRTHFANPTGLTDAANVTTARDIATLSAALLRNFPRYYTYFGQRSANYRDQVYGNHNTMLGHFLGLDGIKTGYTADAGFTLAASAVRNGRRLIGVVLGEPSQAQRSRDMAQMLEDGFATIATRAGELRLSGDPPSRPPLKLPYHLD